MPPLTTYESLIADENYLQIYDMKDSNGDYQSNMLFKCDTNIKSEETNYGYFHKYAMLRDFDQKFAYLSRKKSLEETGLWKLFYQN